MPRAKPLLAPRNWVIEGQMSAKLDQQRDWRALAASCEYRVGQMAQALHVSVRWLEISFRQFYGRSPHALCAQWRLEAVEALARDGVRGKHIAAAVGFASYGNLCRSVKSQAGKTLKEFARSSI